MHLPFLCWQCRVMGTWCFYSSCGCTLFEWNLWLWAELQRQDQWSIISWEGCAPKFLLKAQPKDRSVKKHLSEVVGLPGQPGPTHSEAAAEFISRNLQVPPWGSLAEECEGHKARDSGAASVWRRFEILSPLWELFICGSWMPLCMMLYSI